MPLHPAPLPSVINRVCTCVRVLRGRNFTAGLFRLALRTARDVLVFDVVLRVVFLPYSLLRSLLMGGIHNIGSRVENLW